MVHFHPNIELIPCVAHRPHLSLKHEHAVIITVTARTEGVKRQVDLLLLQDALEKLLQEKVIDFDDSSFESVASYFGEVFMTLGFNTVSKIEIDADGVEGATIHYAKEHHS